MMYGEPISVDMEGYKRRQHFEYFRGLAYPYTGVTCNVDITDFLSFVKGENLNFFLSFLWCVSRAANGVVALRQRIYKEGIIEYSRCETSHTVAKEDETFAYCRLSCEKPLREFLSYAKEEQEKVKKGGNISEDEETSLSFFFVSSLPWISYTSFIQAVPSPADSNPRISWGKYFVQEGRVLLPVTILCHHALVDGLHIASFNKGLAGMLEECIVKAGDSHAKE